MVQKLPNKIIQRRVDNQFQCLSKFKEERTHEKKCKTGFEVALGKNCKDRLVQLWTYFQSYQKIWAAFIDKSQNMVFKQKKFIFSTRMTHPWITFYHPSIQSTIRLGFEPQNAHLYILMPLHVVRISIIFQKFDFNNMWNIFIEHNSQKINSGFEPYC